VKKTHQSKEGKGKERKGNHDPRKPAHKLGKKCQMYVLYHTGTGDCVSNHKISSYRTSRILGYIKSSPSRIFFLLPRPTMITFDFLFSPHFPCFSLLITLLDQPHGSFLLLLLLLLLLLSLIVPFHACIRWLVLYFQHRVFREIYTTTIVDVGVPHSVHIYVLILLANGYMRW